MLITHENSGGISPFILGRLPDKKLILLSAPFGKFHGSANI